MSTNCPRYQDTVSSYDLAILSNWEYIWFRNLSQGSSDTGFFGGSLEKEKRRKQQKLDEGRIDAELVINELMEGVDLDKAAHEEAESNVL